MLQAYTTMAGFAALAGLAGLSGRVGYNSCRHRPLHGLFHDPSWIHLSAESGAGRPRQLQTLRAAAVSIRSRLALGLVFLLVINLGIGLYGLYLFRASSQQATAVREQAAQIVATALTAQVHFKKQVQEWKNILLRGGDAALLKRYHRQFESEEQTTETVMNTLLAMLPAGHPETAIAQDFVMAHQRLGRQYRSALQFYRSEQPLSALQVDRRVRGIDREPTDLIDQLVEVAVEQERRQLKAISREVKATEQRILVTMVLAMSGTVLLLLWLVNYSIARPIATATRIARRVSEGDYSTPIVSRGNNEYSQMLAALKLMQENLATTLASLHSSEAQTRLLLESTAEGIFGMDDEGRCVFCNPAAARLLGYAGPEQLLGRNMHPTMHHSRADGSPLAVQDCRICGTFRDGRSAHVDDEVFWRADGSAFPVDYQANPIRSSGGHGGSLTGAVVNFSDISARRQAEIALRDTHQALQQERQHLAARVEARTAELASANAELARSSRAKDEFLAAMSHELRTPLTSILGLSETLEDQLLGELNVHQTRATHTIHENGVHLLALINDVLDMSRVASGRMKLTWDQVPAVQLCDASLRMIRGAAEAKDISVSSELDPAVALLQGDSRSLKQILVNLLGNAVKFTPAGGSIGLEMHGDAAEKQLRIAVWDTGVGIPPAQQENLFQPFVQLDNRLSRSHDGTGLGLALAFAMAKLHHGSIDLQSEPGKGSRFELLLPWDPAAQGDTEIADAEDEDPGGDAATGLSNRLLLLVDDHPDNRHMIADYLRRKGCQVIVASSGAEAVSIARERHPSLVLMDVQMPGMDGLEATRQIRDDPMLAVTPILALTALAMPGDKERCLEAGMDDYLVKPIGLKELYRVVLSWVRRTGGW